MALLLVVPLNWLLLDIPRLLVDDAVLGHAFVGRTTAPFLPLTIDLPYPWLEEPLPLFEGLMVDRRGYFLASCVLIAGLILGRALIFGLVSAARNILSRRMARELRIGLFRRLLVARAAARDDAAVASNLSGAGTAAIASFLGDAIIVPAMALSLVAIIVIYAASLGLWFGGLMLAIALAHAAMAAWVATTQEARVRARIARERAIAQATLEASGRALAVRIHGTADTEEGAFAATLRRLDEAWRRVTQRVTIALQARDGLRELAPLLMTGFASYGIISGKLSVGGLIALLFAVIQLPRSMAALVTWRRERDEARAVFQDIARTNGALLARERRDSTPTELTTASGPLVATDVAAYDPQSGVRVAGITTSIELPAHIALVGDSGSGADVFARLIGGGVEPSAGTLTLAGTDLGRLTGKARAKHIAYAGGAPVILPASLRDNLLYGALKGPIADRTLIEAITVAGIDDEVYALGLAGNIDGNADQAITATVLSARRSVREALAGANSADLVDPFDPSVYNTHATVAENLMFGMPVGDTFREANLARHPFVRAVLEAEDLTGALEEQGLAIARSMVEIFQGVPDGHPLFERFSFFSASERGAYEDLLARHTRAERQRGTTAARDRELLIALAFRYVETRHRLGLLDPRLQDRIVRARATFRSLLPPSLGPAVEFYNPAMICSAASLADNLLFGRVAHDVAGAEDKVQGIVRRVLADGGLDHLVFQVGLSAQLSEREPRGLVGNAAGLDLARCLIREPDILVASQIVAGLGTAETQALVERLKRTMTGRSLVLQLPDSGRAEGFDAVLRFERGTLAAPEDRSDVGETV
ncbi:ABC transporter transmembrane domain-containing protein [Chelatococcus reniformis]|uniref:ABC transporter transmembrane domain-containing protein n=1 Tax=Chelatococcus reniformis TaxID=1494448 RepID=UPI001667A9CB|nr:ABC transporter ATP-binding protein [Chelatococcus reniformis]